MPVIALDTIDPPIDGARKRPASIEADAALQTSITSLGICQPLLVVAIGNRFAIVDGDRRRRMAIAAGLKEAPCHIFARADEGAIAAAAAAANMVRAPMDPLDEWRAIVRLQGAGYTLDAAADCLGLQPRHARRLDKLGRLHPDVLALIEESGAVPWNHLPAIANALPAAQAKAIKVKAHVQRAKGGKLTHVSWWDIVRGLQDGSKRLSRALAIFDPAQHPEVTWEEDFFAEPDSPEQFTTTDVSAFTKAQLAALKELVKAKKGKLQIIDNGELPKGYDLVSSGPTYAAPRAGETAFATLRQEGRVSFITAVNRAEAKKKKKEREKKRTEKAAAAHADTVEAGGDAEEREEEAAETTVKLPFTKAGQKLIADAKTGALRAALRSRSPEDHISWPSLVAMLTLALHARNVNVRGYAPPENVERSEYRANAQGDDLVRKLIEPGGILAGDEHIIETAAREALARTLSFDTPDSANNWHPNTSGPTAEWIGAGVSADRHLPRLDTADVLATLAGDELKRLAVQEGIKLSKVSELRKHLEGALPDWRPAAAQFGAPRPAETTPEEGEGEEEERGDG